MCILIACLFNTQALSNPQELLQGKIFNSKDAAVKVLKSGSATGTDIYSAVQSKGAETNRT